MREDEYAVQFNAWAIWQLDGETLDDAANKAAEHRAAERLSDRSVEVLAFVNTCPAAVQAEDVAEAVGIDKATANTYLARLATAGKIVRASRGLYTPVRSVRSVRKPTLTTLLMNLQSTDLTLLTHLTALQREGPCEVLAVMPTALRAQRRRTNNH